MEHTISIRPSVCFEVQKVIGVTIGEGNQRNYQVQWAPTWVSGFHLIGCEHLIEEFIQQKQSDNSQMIDTQSQNHCKSEVEDVNIPDLPSKQKFSNIPKGASISVTSDEMDEKQESGSGLYTNIADNSGNTVTPLETNIPVGIETNVPVGKICISEPCESKDKNPNFEWAEKGVDNVNKDENPVMLTITSAKEFQVEDKGEECMAVEKSNIDRSVLSTDESKHKTFYYSMKMIQCIVCHKLFENTTELMTHCNAAHDPRDGFECRTCHRKFQSKASLLKHEQTHRPENTFNCPVCSKVYLNERNLQAHMHTHTNPPPSHKCNACEKTFVTTTLLRRHERIHTGERPFECDVCKQRFNRKDILQRHSYRHKKDIKTTIKPPVVDDREGL